MRFFYVSGGLLVLGLTLWGCQGRSSLPGDLLGKEWAVVEINGEPVSLQKPPFLRFEEPDRVTGFSGCNRMSGTYQMTGESVQFTPFIMTKMACAEGMDVETAMVGVLESTKRVRVTGSTLELLGDSGVLAKLSAH